MNPNQSINDFINLQRSIIDEQQLIIMELQEELRVAYTKLNNIYDAVRES